MNKRGRFLLHVRTSPVLDLGLTVAEYLLADEGPGDGGFAVVAGSHKANLPMPKSLSLMEDHTHAVTGMPAVRPSTAAHARAHKQTPTLTLTILLAPTFLMRKIIHSLSSKQAGVTQTGSEQQSDNESVLVVD